MQLRSYTDALLCFDRALALSSACVPALLNRAMCYHRLGNLSRAEEDYSAVIALAPVRYPLRDPCCCHACGHGTRPASMSIKVQEQRRLREGDALEWGEGKCCECAALCVCSLPCQVPVAHRNRGSLRYHAGNFVGGG